MDMTKIICLIIALSALSRAQENGDFFNDNEIVGPNICTKLETIPVEITTTELQSYQERTTVWCLEFPPKCTQYRIKNKIVNKTQILNKTQVARECCQGYKRDGSSCIPVCKQDCHKGQCIAPDKCKCPPGYGGPTCEVICPPGFWGHNCERPCDCQNGAACDPYTGICRCTDEFTGEKCEEKKCSKGFFGPRCDQICNCANRSACEKDTGSCVCSSGWTGVDCSTPCSDGYYGVNCQEKCPESEHGKTCDHVTGALLCDPGYIGIACEHNCPTGYYGHGCTQKCNCEHGAECDHISGGCECNPGWIGKFCNITCPNDFYGKNCSENCRCQNHEGCRKTDGLCNCKAGWMGTICDQVCPEGFYGQHCMLYCSCPRNFICHAAKGCVCPQGYTGENCDLPTVEERVQKAEVSSSNNGLMFLMLSFFLLFVVIVLVILYYRRRVSNLKTEIHHVQYISDATRPEAHNFDNPVYAVYGTHPAETHLLNNLRPKINNLDSNSGKLYVDGSNSSSRSTYSLNYNHDMLAKNLNADLTNPNVYHSIDDNRKEHVYDEIKPHKDSNNPDEYDHLDYTGPSTSQKPHYHRMDNVNINCDEEKPSTLKAMNVFLESGAEKKNDKEEICDSNYDNTNYSPVGSPSSIQKNIN